MKVSYSKKDCLTFSTDIDLLMDYETACNSLTHSLTCTKNFIQVKVTVDPENTGCKAGWDVSPPRSSYHNQSTYWNVFWKLEETIEPGRNPQRHGKLYMDSIQA